MLGLLLIYWIGKKYYELATEHNRSPWGYAILGVFVYYFSQNTPKVEEHDSEGFVKLVLSK